MSYNSFKDLIAECEEKKPKKKVAVVCAQDEHTLEAIAMAYEKEVVVPVLIGDKAKIEEKIKQYVPVLKDCQIIATTDNDEAVQIAVEMVKKGEVGAVVKGIIETATLLKQVVKKENEICPSGVMSHIAIAEIPTYKKLIGISDSAMLTYPDLAKKKQLIINAVSIMKNIVGDKVKVAVLAAVEVVNPKMPETVEARQLQEMAEAGEITDCIIEGPLSYDIAMNKEAAEIKGFKSEVSGDADLLIVPNIQAGNILIKSLTVSAKAKTASLVLGAKVPIVITSRSSSVTSKYQSVVFAASI